MIPLSDSLQTELRELLGPRFSTAATVRDQHAGGGMHLPPLPPQAVASVESLDEIVRVVRACAAHGAPIIPFGAGTSLECHVGAPRGGVCMDVSAMKRVLRLSPEDQDCTVEAGLTRIALNEHP